jgi:hypothetical protein
MRMNTIWKQWWFIMKTRGKHNDNFTWMKIHVVEIVTMIKRWWHYDHSNLTLPSTMMTGKLLNNSQYIVLNDRLNEWWTGKAVEEVALTSSRYYPGICLERRWRTNKNFNLDNVPAEIWMEYILLWQPAQLAPTQAPIKCISDIFPRGKDDQTVNLSTDVSTESLSPTCHDGVEFRYVNNFSFFKHLWQWHSVSETGSVCIARCNWNCSKLFLTNPIEQSPFPFHIWQWKWIHFTRCCVCQTYSIQWTMPNKILYLYSSNFTVTMARNSAAILWHLKSEYWLQYEIQI